MKTKNQTKTRTKNQEEEILSLSKFSWAHKIAFVFFSLFFVAALWFSILPFKAERHFRDGYVLEIKANMYFKRGQKMTALRYNKNATAELEKARKAAPWETYYQFLLALLYQKLGDQSESINDKLLNYRKSENTFNEIIQLDDHRPWFHEERSKLYLRFAMYFPRQKREYFQKAEKDKMTAVKLDQNNPLFHIHAGNFYYLNRNFEKAKFYYRKALNIDDALSQPAYYLADILMRENNQNEGIRLFESVYEREPLFKNVGMILGQWYMQQSQYQNAEQIFRNVIKHRPDDVAALQSLINLFERTNQTKRKKEFCYQMWFQFSETNTATSQKNQKIIDEIKKLCFSQ